MCISLFSFHFKKTCIATHESNGIDIIIALILNDINPLGKYCMDLVLQLKVWKIFLFIYSDSSNDDDDDENAYARVLGILTLT